MRTLSTAVIVLLVMLFPIASAVSDAGDAGLRADALKVFRPLPDNMATPDAPITPARVALGRMLFFEPRVSVDGTVSCSRCHLPQLYATDGLTKPIGAEHRVNPRNSPTVLNAALQTIGQHWRGDRTSVEDQAMKALIGPPSFGNPDFDSAMAKLKAIPEYGPLFARAFPGEQDPITAQNWGKAIGAYERTLVTPAPFDAFLKGDDGALDANATAGLRDFMQIGCAGCHNGPGVGGGLFQKFGVVEDYWKATGSAQIDKGRFDVTTQRSDLYVFKVPQLRNVAKTPPYFHDGSVATLPDAVKVMARVQLGRTLTEEQQRHLVAFLESLTGELPADFATPPILPSHAFTAATPRRPGPSR